MLPHNQLYNNNSLMKEVWDVESNRCCGECLKPLELNEARVLLDPAVIFLCSECTQLHESILSKKAQETEIDLQQKSKFSFKYKLVGFN